MAAGGACSVVVALLRTRPRPAAPRWAGLPRSPGRRRPVGRTRTSPANERARLAVALDLQLQVRRPADCRLWVNEGRLLGAVQERRWTVGGHGHHALHLSREVEQPAGERPRRLRDDPQLPQPLSTQGRRTIRRALSPQLLVQATMIVIVNGGTCRATGSSVR